MSKFDLLVEPFNLIFERGRRIGSMRMEDVNLQGDVSYRDTLRP